MQEERNHKEQNEWELVLSIKDIIFSLNEGNNTQSVNIIIDKFDKVHPFSFNLIIIQMIYDTFALRMDNPLIYLKFMKEIQEKSKINIIDEFTSYLLNKRTHESNYLIDTMIEQKILEPKIVSNISDPYFTHYKEETKQSELSVNDQELHKELLKEGHNPNEITKIIRNDDIEKLQEISSQTNFNFNQTIEPSLYERCSFINKPNISLIDYAAFFGSIKCFKFLLINGTDVSNASKYAVAGGNEEIIHICEQNHLSFYKGQETAIKFHQNDIFLYLYENKIKQINNFEELGKKCISHNNYEIFSFLQEKGMTINDEIINKTALIGNFYLVRYFLNEKQPPKDILSFSVRSNNLELIKYILEQKDININERSIYMFYLKFIYIIWKLFKIFQTALMLASSNNKIEIVKLLLEQKEIDINAKNRIYFNNSIFENYFWKLFKIFHTALMDASYDGHAEIVKLLLEQEGIDINVKGVYLLYLDFILIF